MINTLRIIYYKLFKRLNKYSAMQKAAYHNGTSDHDEHNSNSDYWDILLGSIKTNPEFFNGKKALDFGCGKGRNIQNLSSLAAFSAVDGVDISQANIDFCSRRFKQFKSTFFCNSGTKLDNVTSNYYDFVMSTIVFQHIAVHEIRKSLMEEIFRVLKPGGQFSFQMGFGDSLIDPEGKKLASYYDNIWSAEGTNSNFDVQVMDKTDIFKDLDSMGFSKFSAVIRPSFSDIRHKDWIYINATK